MKRSHRIEAFSIAVVAGFFVMAAWANEPMEVQYCSGTEDSKSLLYAYAQHKVRGHLLDPSSAEMPPRADSVSHIRDCVYRVTGRVTAVNAFGVPMRAHYTIDVGFDKTTQNLVFSGPIISQGM